MTDNKDNINSDNEPDEILEPKEKDVTPNVEVEPEIENDVSDAEVEDEDDDKEDVIAPEPKKRKPINIWVKILIAVVAVAALLVTLHITSSNNEKEATPKATSTADVKDANGLTDTERESLSSGAGDQMATLIASDIQTQYGADSEIVTGIQATRNYATQDLEGVPAKITIIQFTGIPADFDYAKNLAGIKTGIAVNEDWIFDEELPEVENVEILASLRTYDKKEKTDNPVILEITYVRETGDAAVNGSMTAIITSTVY
jgi:hypothetical protein